MCPLTKTIREILTSTEWSSQMYTIIMKGICPIIMDTMALIRNLIDRSLNLLNSNYHMIIMLKIVMASQAIVQLSLLKNMQITRRYIVQGKFLIMNMVKQINWIKMLLNFNSGKFCHNFNRISMIKPQNKTCIPRHKKINWKWWVPHFTGVTVSKSILRKHSTLTQIQSKTNSKASIKQIKIS